MSSAIIYFFTGTKNTLITANMIKNQIEAEGVKTVTHEVKRPFESIPLPIQYDYIGFGYPIHAFNCPQIFLAFVRMLPQGNRKKAFIFKTSGEPFKINDASSYKLYKILCDRNYDIVLEKHLLMPYNIMFRYKDSLVKQMYLYNQALCQQLVTQLLNGERSRFKYHLHHRFASLVFRIQWMGAILNGRLYSVNKKKCTLCMRCVNDCPSKNITFKDGKFTFGYNCAMCMRCVMFCPANAINPGLLRLWKVNGAYDFQKILGDPNIASDYINAQTKGYFRLFKKHLINADNELAKYDIDVTGNLNDKSNRKRFKPQYEEYTDKQKRHIHFDD